MSGGIELSFHGAAHTVTGSCMEISAGGHRLLVDCGLFQGSRSLEQLNRLPFTFNPAEIEAVVLTHAHIDHSGLLPRLVAEGFSGPIWCTPGTRDLLGYMLPDAARIQEGDAMRRNRRKDRADEPAITPLYTQADADLAVALARPVALCEWFEPVPGLRARMWNAGHILGSASVEIQGDDQTLLFSGDLGPEYKSFYPDPDGPAGVDHVICESTYGNRERVSQTIEERRTLLEQEVKAAMARGGNLIIPVFAVERTQELLLDLARLINAGRLKGTRVFIDSPLASRATSVFARHAAELEDLGDGEVFRHHAFHYVESAAESIRLNSVSGAIILSASGMCEAGRIRHHLVHNLSRPDSTILFVGYQAEGTLGRTILDGAQRVRISGRDLAVRAHIRKVDSYSAHADRRALIDWVDKRAPIHGSLFLVHGEKIALESLRDATQDKGGSVVLPEIGERYRLSAGAPAKRLATGRLDVRQVVGRDWQNDYADFSLNLKRELGRIRDEGRRREAIRRMREVLGEYNDHRSRRRRH